MAMIDTSRELRITTKAHTAFTLRLSPSYRAIRIVRTPKYGEPEQRAIKTAEAIGDKLEAVMSRGYFTKRESRDRVLPDALWFAEEMPQVKTKDEVVFKRVLILK